jgi:hypothetical protein
VDVRARRRSAGRVNQHSQRFELRLGQGWDHAHQHRASRPNRCHASRQHRNRHSGRTTHLNRWHRLPLSRRAWLRNHWMSQAVHWSLFRVAQGATEGLHGPAWAAAVRAGEAAEDAWLRAYAQFRWAWTLCAAGNREAAAAALREARADADPLGPATGRRHRGASPAGPGDRRGQPHQQNNRDRFHPVRPHRAGARGARPARERSAGARQGPSRGAVRGPPAEFQPLPPCRPVTAPRRASARMATSCGSCAKASVTRFALTG